MARVIESSLSDLLRSFPLLRKTGGTDLFGFQCLSVGFWLYCPVLAACSWAEEGISILPNLLNMTVSFWERVFLAGLCMKDGKGNFYKTAFGLVPLCKNVLYFD